MRPDDHEAAGREGDVREDRPGRVRRGAGAGDDPVHESRRGERDG